MDDERIDSVNDLADSRPDPHLEHAIALLRTAVPVDASAFDARVLAAVRRDLDQEIWQEVPPLSPAVSPAAPPRVRRIGFPPRTFAWVAAAALAASVAVAVVLGRDWRLRGSTASSNARASTLSAATLSAATSSTAPRGTQLVRFRFTGAHAAKVAVAGSFNGWSTSTTPLRRVGDTTWVADVALGAGRHVYQFVIDDHRWVPDPEAPRDAGDDFGTSNSVVTVVLRNRS